MVGLHGRWRPRGMRSSGERASSIGTGGIGAGGRDPTPQAGTAARDARIRRGPWGRRAPSLRGWGGRRRTGRTGSTRGCGCEHGSRTPDPSNATGAPSHHLWVRIGTSPTRAHSSGHPPKLPLVPRLLRPGVEGKARSARTRRRRLPHRVERDRGREQRPRLDLPRREGSCVHDASVSEPSVRGARGGARRRRVPDSRCLRELSCRSPFVRVPPAGARAAHADASCHTAEPRRPRGLARSRSAHGRTLAPMPISTGSVVIVG